MPILIGCPLAAGLAAALPAGLALALAAAGLALAGAVLALAGAVLGLAGTELELGDGALVPPQAARRRLSVRIGRRFMGGHPSTEPSLAALREEDYILRMGSAR
jgi:hypothetical protein